MDSDDMDREHDPSDAEPYLSVVEFDGDGDNWGRSGHPPMGRDWTDVEDVNGGDDDPAWWEWSAAPVREGAHV